MVVFEGVDNRSTQDASQRPAPETEKHQRYRNHLQQLNVLEISKKNTKHCIEKKLLYFQQNIAENHQVLDIINVVPNRHSTGFSWKSELNLSI